MFSKLGAATESAAAGYIRKYWLAASLLAASLLAASSPRRLSPLLEVEPLPLEQLHEDNLVLLSPLLQLVVRALLALHGLPELVDLGGQGQPLVLRLDQQRVQVVDVVDQLGARIRVSSRGARPPSPARAQQPTCSLEASSRECFIASCFAS